MKAGAAAAGQGGSSSHEAPLVVGSRSRPIVLVALVAVGAAILMLAVRRTELDFEDWLWSAGALVFACWLLAQSVGLLLRRAAAGHAMRLDAAGLHHPGWGVVPWSAVQGVRFRRLGGDRSLFHLVLDIEPGCVGPSQGSYVRWLFGPIEGLWRRHGRTIEIPLIALDAEPQALVAAAERWRAGAGSRP